ncbi:beta-glucosidase family protein [Streptomyces sp. SPB074]|uniref:beta-glucosidase family protein n=1 Tax=Streptomyces sp. (strain SPB074) TaxID=465543 RepID=UPI00055ABA53|nr:beta-glucosidase [Streptomyces sp. SPB074]
MTAHPPVPSPHSPGTGPGALTTAQMASLTSGAGDFVTEAAGHVPAVSLSDGPHGLRLPREAGDGGQLSLRSAAPATCFPPAVALGSSWDPALAERVGAAIAAEARDHGVHVVLGPGVNIKRSPLCGRNFEYFSKDPLVSAELGGAMVRGLQNAGVGAALKHFAANNQETDRMRVSADVDERPLREIYLRAFERIVRRDRPWSVMAAYNAVNGVPLSENRRLLTAVLREEWGFDGIVTSDWGAVRDRLAALRAGLDLQMPGTRGRTDREVVRAVENGGLPRGELEAAVERLAVFARRATAAGGDAGPVSHEAHHRLAREAAERCVVLLKNDGALLPLDPGAGSVAVIGELARTPRYQGGGSSQVTPTRLELLARVTAANPRTAVVLSHGGVVRTSPWQDTVPALVEGWLLGQGGGHALASVLFGHANPSGRLAETIPLRLEDSPSYLSFPGEEGHVRYAEGVFVGYRGHDRRGDEVAFPFGHGLSYTTFSYDGLRVEQLPDGTLDVRVTVTNTGAREGREVAQVYVRAPRGSRVARPVRELRGFARVDLEPGASREVRVLVDRADLAYYSEREAGWCVEGGTYVVEAGASSRDIRGQVEVAVAGDVSGAALSGRDTLGEWFEHPVGGPLLRELLAHGGERSGAGALADPAVRRFLAGIPLDVIADFPGSPVPLSEVPALCERVARASAAGGARR